VPGGGLALAAMCDFRVAAKDARFGAPEIEVAHNMGWHTVPRLVAILGVQATRRILMTGERVVGRKGGAGGRVRRLDGGAGQGARQGPGGGAADCPLPGGGGAHDQAPDRGRRARGDWA
jgi:enoyl-CoA hydratase